MRQTIKSYLHLWLMHLALLLRCDAYVAVVGYSLEVGWVIYLLLCPLHALGISLADYVVDLGSKGQP